MVLKKLLKNQPISVERTKDQICIGRGDYLEGKISASYDLVDKTLSVIATNQNHSRLMLVDSNYDGKVESIYYNETRYVRSEDEESFQKADAMLAEYKNLLNYEESLVKGVELPVKQLNEILEEF